MHADPGIVGLAGSRAAIAAALSHAPLHTRRLRPAIHAGCEPGRGRQHHQGRESQHQEKAIPELAPKPRISAVSSTMVLRLNRRATLQINGEMASRVLPGQAGGQP